MKSTTSLRNDKDDHAKRAHSAIVEFFDILQPRSDEAKTEGLKLLEQICKNAMELSLMMRSAKDEYIVYSPPFLGQLISGHEDLIEEEDFYPATKPMHIPGTIKYYITDALIKYPYGSTKDMIVLQKAQAVVYSVPDKKD